MDSYERFIRVLDFEEPDRTPIFDSINNIRVFHEIGGYGSPEEVMPKTYHRLGMDISFQSFSYIPWVLPREGRIVRIWDDNKWGNILFSKPFKHKYIVYNDGTHSDQIVERPFKNLEELIELKMEPAHTEDELVERYVSNYRNLAKHYGIYGIVVVGCGSAIMDDIPRILSWPLYVRAIHQTKDVVRRIMDIRAIDARANVKAYIEAKAGPAFMVADDIAEKRGLMHPIWFLREEWIPRMREIIYPAIKAGVRMIFHSEGNTEAILDDLIKTGFVGLNPLEPFSMDLKQIKEKYGDRLILTGGIDNWHLLQHGSPTQVERTVRECISIAAPGSGYCPGSSGEINPTTPLENVIALYKAIKKYGEYPKAKVK